METDTVYIEFRHKIDNAHDGQKIDDISWSPDGTKFATGSSDFTIKLWDFETGKICYTPSGEKFVLKEDNFVFHLSWSPDGKRLACGTVASEKNVGVWDMIYGKKIAQLEGHQYWIESIKWSPDGNYIASGGADNKVIIWETTNWKILFKLKLPGKADEIAFSPINNWIAVRWRESKSVKIWDIFNQKQIVEIEEHPKLVRCIAWSSDGRKLATGSTDNKIRIWDTDSWKCANILEGHKDIVCCLRFFNNDRFVISASSDRTLRIWSCSYMKQISVTPYESQYYDLEIHPKLPVLATIGGLDNNDVYFWDIDIDHLNKADETASFIVENEDHSSIVRSIEFPPEYKQSGMAILNYFGDVLKKKYPKTKAKVTIEQNDLKVKMIIEPEDGGNKEIIEKTLDNYGLVVIGKMTPEQFSEGDKFLEFELINELRMAYLRIESQRELLQITEKGYGQRIQSLEEEIGWLRNSLGDAIRSGRSHDMIGDKADISKYTVKVFISCAEDDVLTANKIYADLQKKGIDTWLAHKDIKPGGNKEFAVRKAIRDCVYFLALLSTSSVNQRGAFQKELKQALDMLAEHPDDGIFIIPVRLDDCNPTDAILDDLHIVDLHMTSWNDGLKKIVQALSHK